MLVYDGSMHAGQLQFRPYVPNTVSPNGLYDPLYWMDFKGHAPPLPSRTLALFCYHVGQRDDTSDRDARYFGRGIGLRLLEETLKWATSAGFEAVVAKGCPRFRPVIEYMGGMPTEVYKTKDFEVAASYHDPELRMLLEDMLQNNALEGVDVDEADEVSVCIRMLTL